MGKLPAFQFYPSDWQSDLELQSCSLAARGLWIELIGYMHNAKPYGHLIVNGKLIDDSSACKLVRTSLKVYRKAKSELIEKGVIKLTEDGVIYSPRMIKDQQLREMRKEVGKLGGNPDLVNQKVNQNSEFGKHTVPPPSSSSSFSSSNTTISDAVIECIERGWGKRSVRNNLLPQELIPLRQLLSSGIPEQQIIERWQWYIANDFYKKVNWCIQTFVKNFNGIASPENRKDTPVKKSLFTNSRDDSRHER